MRFNTKLVTRFVSAIIFICFISLSNSQDTKAKDSEHNVAISTTPAHGFLIADNLAPGDKVSTTLKVGNLGDFDFDYSVSSNLESGNSNLYNQMLLTITDSNGQLYNGQLKKLSYLSLGTIAKKGTRELTFTAELPVNAGNEVQGKNAKVTFDFTAIGKGNNSEVLTPVDGSNLPNTGTDIFNFIITGLGLIFVGMLIQAIRKLKKAI